MRQMVISVIMSALVVGSAVTEPSVRQVGSVAWQQVSTVEFSGGHVTQFGDYLVFFDDDGAGRVVRIRENGRTLLSARYDGIADFSLSVNESEGHARQVRGTARDGDGLWVVYRYRRAREDGVLQPLHQFFYIDLALPGRPRVVSSTVLEDLYAVRRLAASEGYLFASSFGLGVSVLSADPTVGPELLKQFHLNSETVSVTVTGDTLIAADHNRGIVSIDIRDPREPRVLGEVNTGRTWEVLVNGNTAYAVINSGVATVDITEPTSPQVLGKATFEYLGDTRGHGVLVDQRLAVFRVIPRAPDRLEVYDVADVREPRLVRTLPVDEVEPPLLIAGSSIVMTPLGVAYDFNAPASPENSDGAVFAEGELTIPATWWWNPDTGTLGGRYNGLWWAIKDSRRRELVPRNMSVRVLEDVTFDDVTREMIADTELHGDPIQTTLVSSVLKPGTVVAFRTPEGRPGKLLVTEIYDQNDTRMASFDVGPRDWRSRLRRGDSDPFSHLGIRYVVFAADSSVN